MSVIVNTPVISNFASIGQLDVLRHLYGALAMSTEVDDEIQAGLAEGLWAPGGPRRVNGAHRRNPPARTSLQANRR
jgi:predicted nucleic acid-binding protein